MTPPGNVAEFLIDRGFQFAENRGATPTDLHEFNEKCEQVLGSLLESDADIKVEQDLLREIRGSRDNTFREKLAELLQGNAQLEHEWQALHQIENVQLRVFHKFKWLLGLCDKFPELNRIFEEHLKREKQTKVHERIRERKLGAA